MLERGVNRGADKTEDSSRALHLLNQFQIE